MTTNGHYYVPEKSPWPIITMLGVLFLVSGAVLAINSIGLGNWLVVLGLGMFALILYGWFRDVVMESMSGAYNAQVDRSFRQGMFWFIASEVFFFLGFFGALFYLRTISLEWMGGEGYLAATREFLWPDYVAEWPTAGPEQVGGPFQPMGAWGLPAINTAILLSSGVTITWAHWALKLEKNRQLVLGLAATVLLGALFVVLQAWEYGHAYTDLNLTLGSGVYGSTFYMLTGFHGFHVCMGAIMLMAILGRAIKGHFTPHNHFAFEAVAWYWHFVDVVWLGLFVFVYWL